MVFLSSHINHEFLILVMQVTNVSFAIKHFFHLRKSVDNNVTYEEYFHTPKILVSFFTF